VTNLPSAKSIAEERLARELDARRVDHELALGALTEQQQRAVAAFLVLGNRRAAVEAAGYTRVSHEVTRLWRNPHFLRAIETGVALRSADAKPITKGDLIARLEAMLSVRREDLLEFNEAGVPVGVKDLTSLPAATQAAVRTLRAKVRRSATGERAHCLDVELELVDPLRIIELLCQVHGWIKRGPQAVAIAQTANLRSPVGTAGISAEDAEAWYRREKDQLPEPEPSS
jgi:hypothetical protein